MRELNNTVKDKVYTKEDYDRVNQLLKQKSLTITELKTKVKELRETNRSLAASTTSNTSNAIKIQELEKANKKLQEENQELKLENISSPTSESVDELKKELQKVKKLKNHYLKALKSICPDCKTPQELIENVQKLQKQNNMYLGQNKELKEELSKAKDKLLQYETKINALEDTKGSKPSNVSTEREKTPSRGLQGTLERMKQTQSKLKYLDSQEFRDNMSSINYEIQQSRGKLSIDKSYSQEDFKRDINNTKDKYNIPHHISSNELVEKYQELSTVTREDLKDLNNYSKSRSKSSQLEL
jgi:DNA repair exonuclease SbcCD ATPase subunit